MKLIKPIAFLLMASFLSGCATDNKQFRERIRSDVLAADLTVNSNYLKNNPSFSTKSNFWVGSKVLNRPVSVLPSVFMSRITLALSAEKIPLAVAASELTRVTGIPVRISADVQIQQSVSMEPAKPVTETQLPGQPALNPAALTPPNYQAWGNSVDLNFNDVPLTIVLDQIAARMGISWEYNPTDGAIYFSRFVTETFVLNVLPGSTTQAASVGKSSGINGFTASSSSGITTNSDTWPMIEAQIKSMMTDKGKIAINPSTQSITVTDVKDTLSKVRAFVKEVNKSMTRQVSIKVDVLTVSLNRGSEMGLNWSAVYNKVATIANSTGVTLNSTPAFAGATGGSMAMSVLSPAGQNGLFDGSTTLIQALQTMGNTSIVDSRRVITLNNQPAPVAVTSQLAYISGITAAQAATTTAPAIPPTPTTSTLTTGYLLNIYPSVVTDRELLLQLSVDISSLVRMTSFAVSGQNISIQQPEVASTQFLQRAKVKMGDTVVLSGYTRKRSQLDERGTLRPDNYALGGGHNAQAATEELVILITPAFSE